MKTPFSPKVIATLVAGVLLAALLAAIQALLGDSAWLASLPPWAALAIVAGLTSLAGSIAGYLKRDPLRDAGQTVITDTTVPAEVHGGDAFDDDQPVT